MKKICTFLSLLIALLLSGCLTTKKDVVIPLSKEEQMTLLKKVIPPQTFGFDVYKVPSGISYRGHTRLRPLHVATEDIPKNGFPIVKTRGMFRREKLTLLLDTHSNVSWVEVSTFQKFDGNFLGFDNKTVHYTGTYDTGKINAFAGVIRQIRISNLFMENNPFYVRMARGSLGPQNRGIKEPHIDAVLGYDNLQSFEFFQIDPFERTIQFSATIPYVANDDLLLTKATIVPVKHFGLAVQGSINGVSTPILLDFAGDLSFSRGGANTQTTKLVTIEDLVFIDAPTIVIPGFNVPPRIGNRILKNYIVTVCPKKGIVYFERPPKLKK